MTHYAKLFHDRNVLLVNHGRMTMTITDVNRETVNVDLEHEGFLPVGKWQHGPSIDYVEVRRKAHRFDYVPKVRRA